MQKKQIDPIINKATLRNILIVVAWDTLGKFDLSNKEKYKIIADEFFLSPERIRNIVYDNTYRAIISELK